jgi:hypothetical protein
MLAIFWSTFVLVGVGFGQLFGQFFRQRKLVPLALSVKELVHRLDELEQVTR